MSKHAAMPHMFGYCQAVFLIFLRVIVAAPICIVRFIVWPPLQCGARAPASTMVFSCRCATAKPLAVARRPGRCVTFFRLVRRIGVFST